MKDSIKSYRINTISVGVMFILLGLAAFFVPETMLEVMGYVIGGALVLAGIVYIVAYLLRDAMANVLRNDFVFGLAAIAIGVVVFTKVKLIVSILPIILGIMVIISGCLKLQNAIDMKRINAPRWFIFLILSVINLVLGAVLVINPFATALLLYRIIGIGLIFSGVTDIVDCLVLSHKVGKVIKETASVEAGYTEVQETKDSAVQETMTSEAQEVAVQESAEHENINSLQPGDQATESETEEI